jgi:hypothetical protein
MHDRTGGRARLVEAEVQRQLLGGRIAGDEPAGAVELRQPPGVEEAEARVGRREQETIV